MFRPTWIVILAVLVIACARVETRTPTSKHSSPSGTRIVLLGTGTPIADPERSGPFVAILAGGRSYLVDFGPGVVRRAAAAYKRGHDALSMERLTRAFLTHLHSDHTAGFADLMFTPWVLGRKQPLQVYGPPGLQSMVDHLQKAYAEDIIVISGDTVPIPSVVEACNGCVPLRHWLR